MLKKLVNAFKTQSWQDAASCFSPERDTVFTDYGPSMIGGQCAFVYGSSAIELYFRNHFYNNTFSIAQERFENGYATYFACYAGRYYLVRLTIEEADASGLIRKAVVRPE